MLINYLAQIWGISITVVCLAVLIKPKYLKMLFAGMKNEAIMPFLGIISFVIGLAMVLSYNVWNRNWQVIITILGWLSLLKGLAIIFLPNLMEKSAKKIEGSPFLPYLLIAMLIVGLAITYFGFTA